MTPPESTAAVDKAATEILTDDPTVVQDKAQPTTDKEQKTLKHQAASTNERLRIIRPSEPFWKIHWDELWKYRYMFLYLVRRDIVVFYKQTVLGPAWVILQPFLMSILFSIIFGQVAGIGTDGIPTFLFYFGNQMIWMFNANLFSVSATVFRKGMGMMNRVYYPRLITPFATVGESLFKLGIQFIFLVGLILYFWLWKGAQVEPGWGLLLLPLVVLQFTLTGLGVGLVIACMSLKYRDLYVIVPVFAQAWMYASPVVYPLSELPSQYAILLALNPATSALELFRFCIFHSSFPPTYVLVGGWMMAFLVFFTGLFTFNVVQRKCIDVV